MPDLQRTQFLAALRAATEEARADETNLALLLIDIANLARINQNRGYEHGDQVLQQTHRALLSISRLPDTVFRIGSHAFAFILPRLDNPALVVLALNRVKTVLHEELGATPDVAAPEFKFGLAINRRARGEYAAMFALAESSLRHVKRGGELDLEGLLGDGNDDFQGYQLEQQLAQALRDNELELYYQPKVRLQDGGVDSAETLLRWTSPDGDPVAPELLVSMVEGMGRSFELAKWVVYQSMRQLQRWQASLDLGLAVNVQAGLVSNPDLQAVFRDAIAIWGVEPARVTLEVTEDAIIGDKDAGLNNLLAIRDSGVNISIDDFGTGYSSLSYFKHIPATELKIDKSFVMSLTREAGNRELVKIMVQIARHFGLSVVAEGVEDRASMELLRSLGCDYGQGYYFSRPLPPQEFEEWLLAWRASGQAGH